MYIYRCTLKKLCEMYLNQKTTALLQGISFVHIKKDYFLKDNINMVYIASLLVTFLASFDRWVCSTASLAGEGLLTSRLAAAHQTGLLHRAFAAWRRSTQLCRGYRAIRTTWERRMLRE